MHDGLQTIAECLASTRQLLTKNGISDSGHEARVLVRAATGFSHSQLLTRSSEYVRTGDRTRLEAMVARRMRHEPLQYITGVVEFYGRDFAVDSRVLIPRPETELIVEQALLFATDHNVVNPRILDMGTGSGILAVTMAAEIPGSTVVATDISADALAVAEANATRHQVGSRIKFKHTSLADDVSGRFDLVLSNPPYVLSGFLDGPDVQPELAYEPRGALDGGKDGMDVYRELLSCLAGLLAPHGAAFIEIDPPVAAACISLAHRWLPDAEVTVLTDLSGLERCLCIETGR